MTDQKDINKNPALGESSASSSSIKEYELECDRIKQISNIAEKYTKGEINLTEKEIENYKIEVNEIYRKWNVEKAKEKGQKGKGKEKTIEELEGAASTSEGKEIIRAEISQELAAARETFANFTIKETTRERVFCAINRKVDKMKYHWDGSYKFGATMSSIPIIGTFTSAAVSCSVSDEAQKSIKDQVGEKIPNLVWNLIKETTTDLEKHKKKVLKKMDDLLEKREQEVAEARKSIKALEVVNREAIEMYKDLQGKSDREIKNLQKEIGELNQVLKEYREKEANARKFLNKQRAEKAKKVMENINSPIQDDQSKIKALQDYVNTLEFNLKFAEDGRDQRASELEKLQNKLERETERLNADLTAKENELARKMKIADDLQKELNEEIRDWQRKHKKIADEKHEIDLENTDLQAKNTELKEKREKAEAEARKWKDEFETEKALHEPTWIQKQMKNLGIGKFKDTIATAGAVASVAGIVYVASLVWKHLIKPAYRNFKGETRPRRKEYDDYDHEESEESEEKKPTIIINNSTPNEAKATKKAKNGKTRKNGKKGEK